MSQNRSGRGRGGNRRSRGGKGGNNKGGANSGNNKGGGNKGGGKGGKRKQNRSKQSRGRKKPVVDPKRDFWGPDAPEDDGPSGEAAAVARRVRPAPDPTALVRSLGPPPLGKYADHAQHYYAAVYDTAQRFAVAVAAANGVLETAENGADPAVEAALEVSS